MGVIDYINLQELEEKCGYVLIDYHKFVIDYKSSKLRPWLILKSLP